MTRGKSGNGGDTCAAQKANSMSRGAAEEMVQPNYTPPHAGGRPPLTSQQSNSLPSTPYQRPRNRSSQSRSPSLGRSTLNPSPRSVRSDSNPTIPNQRRRGGGCKYEAGMARARRRVPYSLGPEKLDAETESLKSHLLRTEDEKLTRDMQALYARLLPSPDSEERRRRLVAKLERLLNERWPGHEIKVRVFGSTGNTLGTTDSDVDICLTTDWKELEQVCTLAEFLASRGMERVVCVSSAKCPIVKIWDPELQLACDLNVNNTVALENTELIRGYVSLDDRVRPLAMIIKHWARRRMLNDAALGMTLSSYTWICMIINFLQTRDPPILPTLQQRSGLQHRILEGFNVAFDKNLDAYSDFGGKNKQSLGELLFQFFRYYGHDFDFEENIISVRMGKIVPKKQKGWHLLQDNRLCVEEPFNTARNLANTADDTSMRGIHLELRRAFGLVSCGQLEPCCEQYEPPQDEGRTSEIFVPPISRPVVTQAPAQVPKATRNATRGGRHSTQFGRSTVGGGRRPSNPSIRGATYLRNLPFQMTPQELQMQAQHQQHLLHDRLFQQYQYLQAQEQELRLQLHQQALLQGRMPTFASYPHISFPAYAPQEDAYDDDASSRASSVSRAPMSAPIRQQQFVQGSPYMSALLPSYGFTTNPSSPHLTSTVPTTQRYARRSSLTQPTTGGSLRAQSQPGRSIPMNLFTHPIQSIEQDSNYLRDQLSPISLPAGHNPDSYDLSANLVLPQQIQQQPVQYLGYYVGNPSPAPIYTRSAGISPNPSHVGLAIQNGGLSPRPHSREPRFVSSQVVPPPDPPSTIPALDDLNRGRHLEPSPPTETSSLNKVRPITPPAASIAADRLPVSCHGLDPDSQEQAEALTFSASTSEDLTFDTPSSSDTQSQAGVDRLASGSLSPSLPSTGLSSVLEQTQGVGHRDMPNGGYGQGNITPADLPVATLAFRLAERCNAARNVKPNDLEDACLSNRDFVDLNAACLKLSDHLSPVAEVPTPPPSQNMSQSKAQASHPIMKGKPENATRSSGPSIIQELAVLSSKTNSHLPSVLPVDGITQPNGWQTQKRKRKSKKAIKPETDIDASRSLGREAVPVDEVMRKGG